MYKGIYIALSGATLKQKQIDLISQNLANANTLGYRKNKISFKDYVMSQQSDIGELPDGRAMSEVSSFATDFSNGSLIRTGNTLDIALDGAGFISLEGSMYTKRGDLKRDKDGYLTIQEGLKVLGNNGPIQIPNGIIEINVSGDISVDGIQIDTMKVVDFPDLSSLIKSGKEIFSSDQKSIPSKATIKQGYLETSNVEVVKEMVLMITSLREFEAYQKVIHAFDEAMAKVTNDMGRI